MAKNTVTTPNWNTDSYENNLSIGQENQFGSTRGLRYGPLRINKTGIFVNNGTLDSTIINNTGFHGYGLSGIEQITLDASTGLNVTDGSNSIFKAEISGTNAGDVTLGAYSSGAGAMYDSSAGTFTVKGIISASSFVGGSISIGSGDSIFKADSNGIYLGNANFASAPFRVNMSGLLTATNANITGTITSTSGTIGGWTIGSNKLYSSTIELATSGIVLGDSTLGISLVVLDSNPYITFSKGGTIKGILTPTSIGDGGIRAYGDFVVNNDKSFLCTGTSGYGSLGVDSSNNFLLTCPSSNEFFVKSTNSDTSYFHTTNSHVYINTRSNGNLYITTGSGKMTMGSNIDMNEKNIDGCDTVWAYNFSNRSDEKLKKNIEESSNNLDLLSKLKPVTFNWKNLNKKLDNKKHLGLIAQDVEKVLPEVVISDDNGVKAINYNELIPLLIGGVNELQKIIKSYNKI